MRRVHGGLRVVDPALATEAWSAELDPLTGHHHFGAIDWAEFARVLNGGGPCNEQRIAHRVRAHEEGAWVREAAAAYAAKHDRQIKAEAVA